MKNNWEKKFDKWFTRDDGLIDKYSWYDCDEASPDTTPNAIKKFISNLLAQEQKQLTQEFMEIVGEVSWKDLKCDCNMCFAHEKALQDLKTKIKEL